MLTCILYNILRTNRASGGGNPASLLGEQEMKKILLLFFLMCGIVFAQGRARMIIVVGDTTDLKNTSGSGVVLLQQFSANNLNGGGFFHRIDSTYAEGRDAFSHPDGALLQWARIGYVEYGEMYIASPDTTSLTTDSTFYLINGFASGNVDGVTATDSAITLSSDAYYSVSVNISYTASDTVKYQIALFKNDVQESDITQDFEVVEGSTAIQNISLNGIVYSDGNDVFKLKVAIMDAKTGKEFVVRKANWKVVKLN